jgi:hypothetical protein
LTFDAAQNIPIFIESTTLKRTRQAPLGGFFHDKISTMAANGAADVTLAGGLLSSPVWASWLAEVNQMLTAITLVIGILIGFVRLWVAWKEQRRKAANCDRNTKSYDRKE